MLNAVKLRLFTRAVIIKAKEGAEIETVIASYTALTEEDKEQLRSAVKKELGAN